jgi:RNA polymerase sigma-70 factor (ECF subfamily)
LASVCVQPYKRPGPRSELAYLLGALRNTFADLQRRRSPVTVPFEEGVEAVGGGSSAKATATAHEVLRAVVELPADFRDVIVALDLGGLSYADAVRSLAIPTGTVMNRLYRARRRVAQRLT